MSRNASLVCLVSLLVPLASLRGTMNMVWRAGRPYPKLAERRRGAVMRQQTENQQAEDEIRKMPPDTASSELAAHATGRAASGTSPAARESRSVAELLQKEAKRLRRSRLLVPRTLLAAAAFTPFAVAGIDGDLGWSGFAILIMGVMLGLGRSVSLENRA